MIQVRKSEARGHANHGWLDTYHTFSFSDYYDPEFTGFRDLLVINEDRIAPGEGFGTHGHENMEIITYVLEGKLEHKDSTGTGSVIHYGDVQRMSAGSGIRHSEFNGSKSDPVHLLQIWIAPSKSAEGIPPSYEEKKFSAEQKRNRLLLIASPKGDDSSVIIHQNAFVYATVLEPRNEVYFSLKAGRYAWLQVARGELSVNGTSLKQGDGAAIHEETKLALSSANGAEFLLFDLP